MEHEMSDQRCCIEAVNAIRQERNEISNARVSPPEGSAVARIVVEVSKIESPEGTGNRSFVVDVKCGEERECRVCHLTSAQADGAAASSELTELGCNCKDDLGVAHVHCAEAWFKLRGNRLCEICGATAKNITGVQDGRFIERQERVYESSSSSERTGGCWRSQPFCNFLMACLSWKFPKDQAATCAAQFENPLSTVNGIAALGEGFSINIAHKWVDLNPHEGEHGSHKLRTQDNNGRGMMEDHPEGKEHLPEQGSPGLVPFFQCTSESKHDGGQILRNPWNAAKRWGETPLITWNC